MQKIEYSKQNLFWRVPILILLTVKMEVERLYTSRGATLEVRLLAEDICFSMYKKYLLSAMLQSESHATYFYILRKNYLHFRFRCFGSVFDAIFGLFHRLFHSWKQVGHPADHTGFFVVFLLFIAVGFVISLIFAYCRIFSTFGITSTNFSILGKNLFKKIQNHNFYPSFSTACSVSSSVFLRPGIEIIKTKKNVKN